MEPFLQSWPMALFRKRNPPELSARLLLFSFFQAEYCYRQSCRLLEKEFGKIDYESAFLSAPDPEIYPSSCALARLKVLSFSQNIQREALPEIFWFCKKLTRRFSEKDGPELSFDVAYVCLGSVIAAKEEDAAWRVYLHRGVYAEPWFFQKHSFLQPWPHTPDFLLERSVLTAIQDVHLIYANEALQ